MKSLRRFVNFFYLLLKDSLLFNYLQRCMCFSIFLFFLIPVSHSQTWISQNSGTTNGLLTVYFIDGQTGWIAGQSGTILKTTDGGQNWVSQVSGTTSYRFVGVFFMDSQTGWVVGEALTTGISNNIILKTTDGGQNWVAQNPNTNKRLYGVRFVDNQTGWIVGENGTILKTIDGGQNWIAQNSGTTNWLERVFFLNNQIGWSVGQGGTIVKTIDGGQNWTTQNSGTNRELCSIYFIDSQTGWTVGSTNVDARILKTTDGGQSWVSQTVNTTNWLKDVHFVNSQIGWAVGFNGTILKTTDGGQNWVSQTSGTTSWLLSIYFTDSQTGWAVGQGGTTILKYVVCPTYNANLVGSTTICAGSSTNLTFNFTGGTNPYSVTYSDGTTITTLNNVTNGQTLSVSPSTNKTYSIISATDANSCMAIVGSNVTITVNQLCSPNANGDIFVTNTNDSGCGSLREAINCANSMAGANTIKFNLSGSAPWIFSPTTIYPKITSDSVVIDATSQLGWRLGRILINGNSIGTGEYVINVDGTKGFEIYGLAFTKNPIGAIWIANSTNFKIGASGKGNVFYNNGRTFLNAGDIYITTSQNGKLQGNILGLDENLLFTNNSYKGLEMRSNVSNIQIGGSRSLGEGNIISKYQQVGITLGETSNSEIYGNNIGTGATGLENMGNIYNGIYIYANANTNIKIGNSVNSDFENWIAYNGWGITREHGNSNVSISRNKIYCNSTGIKDYNSPKPITPPIIQSAKTNLITGTTDANNKIEIFTDANCNICQGKTYLGTATADANGNWSLNGTFLNGSKITATVTDSQNNTSEFAACVTVCTPPSVSITAPTQTLCNGSTVLLTANTAETGLQYQWSHNGTNITNATQATYSANLAGQYAVKVIRANGCDSTATLFIKPQILVDSGLVAYYPFDGDALDYSGNGNHGAVNGASLTTDRFGNSNKAYRFNGINNWISIADNVSLRPNIVTVSAWVNRGSIATGTGSIFYKQPYAVYSLDATGFSIKQNSGCLYLDGTGWQSTAHINTQQTNEWYFIVGVYDGNSLKFYQNGKLIDQKTNLPATVIDNCTGGDFRIGRWHDASSYFFNGSLDDIRIYNRALTAAEIQLLCKPATYNFARCTGDTLKLTTPSVSDVSYTWKKAGTIVAATKPNVTTTDNGTYNLDISYKGCTFSDTTVVNSIKAKPLLSLKDTSVCSGSTVSLQAPTGFSSYQWSDGTSRTTASNTIAPLSTQLVSVTVTDANGCTAADTLQITVKSTANYQVITTSKTQRDTNICTGSSLNLLKAGFDNTATYSWTSIPSSTLTGNNPLISPNVSTKYYLTITGGVGGCATPSKDSVIVNVLSPPVLKSLFKDTTLCKNTQIQMGSAITQPNTVYSWSNLVGLSSSSSSNPTLTVSAGRQVYILTAVNQGNCVSRDTISVTGINLNPLISSSGTRIVCMGDSVVLTANPSSGATYQWQNANGNIPNATSQTYSAKSSDTYNVLVSLNGCASNALPITVTVNPLPVPDASNDTAICQNSTARLWIKNNTTNFRSYKWSTTPPATTATANDTPSVSTKYFVTVTDANGCSGKDSVTITVNQNPKPLVNDTTICSGSTVTLWTRNTSANFRNYNWTNTAGTSVSTNASFTNTPSASTRFYLNVTDANGCSGKDTATITVNSLPTATMTPISVSCFGQNQGSITLTPTVGKAPYNFNWSNGATSQNLNNIAAGTYSVTMTDANDCRSAVLSATLSQPTAPLSISSNPTVSNISCKGQNNGSITLTITGGTPNYTYNWSSSNGFTSNSPNISNLKKGDYKLTVTDSKGCTATTSLLTITEPDPLSIGASTIGNDSCQRSKGNITITGFTGGNGNLSFLWSNGATTQNLKNIGAGNYTLTVTDSRNCKATNSFVVQNKSETVAPIRSVVLCPKDSFQLPISQKWVKIAKIYYDTTYNQYGCYDIRPIQISFHQKVNAQDDEAEIGQNQTETTIEVLKNDSYPANLVDVNIKRKPVFGTIDEKGIGIFNVKMPRATNSTVTFTYEICHLSCVNECDTALVKVLIKNKTAQDIISTAITPNEDGYNDKLDFPDIDWTKYPNNEIEIFNRWGQRIFYAQPYQRNWKGLNDNGQELPAGDYFFILRLNIAEKILVGSVYLQR